MAVNKVVCSGLGTLLDLTSDTITSNKLFSGYTAHAANGELINGSLDILNMSWNDLNSPQFNQNVSDISIGTHEIVPNKVVLGSRTLIDLTSDTVTVESVIAGVVFHSGDGHQTTGMSRLSDLTWDDYENILDND